MMLDVPQNWPWRMSACMQNLSQKLWNAFLAPPPPRLPTLVTLPSSISPWSWCRTPTISHLYFMSNYFEGSGVCTHWVPLILHIVITWKNESAFSSFQSMLHCNLGSTSEKSGLETHHIYSKVKMEVVPELVGWKIDAIENLQDFCEPYSSHHGPLKTTNLQGMLSVIYLVYHPLLFLNSVLTYTIAPLSNSRPKFYIGQLIDSTWWNFMARIWCCCSVRYSYPCFFHTNIQESS